MVPRHYEFRCRTRLEPMSKKFTAELARCNHKLFALVELSPSYPVNFDPQNEMPNVIYCPLDYTSTVFAP